VLILPTPHAPVARAGCAVTVGGVTLSKLMQAHPDRLAHKGAVFWATRLKRRMACLDPQAGPQALARMAARERSGSVMLMSVDGPEPIPPLAAHAALTDSGRSPGLWASGGAGLLMSGPSGSRSTCAQVFLNAGIRRGPMLAQLLASIHAAGRYGVPDQVFRSMAKTMSHDLCNRRAGGCAAQRLTFRKSKKSCGKDPS